MPRLQRNRYRKLPSPNLSLHNMNTQHFPPQIILPEVERRVKAGVDELKGASPSPSDHTPTEHGLSSAEFDRLVADALRVYDSDKTGTQFN